MVSDRETCELESDVHNRIESLDEVHHRMDLCRMDVEVVAWDHHDDEINDDEDERDVKGVRLRLEKLKTDESW